jgi:hypothetical protein
MSVLDAIVKLVPGHDLTPGFNLPDQSQFGIGTQVGSNGIPKAVTGGPSKSSPSPKPAPGGQPRVNSLVTNQANIGGGAVVPTGPSRQFTDALGIVHSTAGGAADSGYNSLNRSIQDYIAGLNENQIGRNNQTIQNYIAKQAGTQGILNMVGQGIRSGGVMLSNKNAADSSATEGIAGAYGQMGRGQLADVGNQFAEAQNQVDLSQAADVRGLHNKESQLPSQVSDTVNGIVNSAQQQLAAIDGQMAGLSLPDRVNMEAEKQKIKNEVVAKLQGFDQILSSQGNATLAAPDQNALQQQAAQQFAAGRGPTNAFNFDTAPAAQFQNTGPFASGLPIFTFPQSSKKVTT